MSDQEQPPRFLPLQLSWPKSKAVTHFSRQHHQALSLACKQLKVLIPDCECATVENLQSDTAISLANGYLKKAVDPKQQQPIGFDRLPDDLPALGHPEWLRDLLWATSCIGQDAAANARLVELIETEISKSIAKQFRSRPQIADDVASGLAAHLFMSIRRGFNRGRPRLAQFSGESTLKTWLKVAAVNMGKDLIRQADTHSAVDLDANGSAIPTEADEVGREGLFDRLKPSLRRAFARLLLQLAEEKKYRNNYQLFDFTVLRVVYGLNPTETAAKLGVVKSRVHEMSGQVLKKFIPLLLAEDAVWTKFAATLADAAKADKSAAASANDIRQALFPWLQKLFDFNDVPPNALEDDDDV